MAKIKQLSLSDLVYNQIKQQILNGDLKAGDRIAEEDFAAEYGVSRTPIREALKKLTEYGLITIVPRSHAIVNSISIKEAQDIAKIRVALEQFAIENFAQETLNEKIDKLQKYDNDCMEALKMQDKARLFESDSLFHSTLIEATDNTILVDLFHRLDAKVQLLRLEQAASIEELGKYLNQHKDIIKYISNNELIKAKELLSKHIIHDLTSHIDN
ncbi:GntR family transcriptional regulator [Clostridium sp.]|uniref:GntR family transcriptional regulator n=1 Tax=Clostridium sp. TaxID=1506 RepID=UPI001A420949|nr:GntR family transcriptional regulator [Clostridium sp.]MBK5237059.1 GntR family transcriptional regulator [Clostridium sp.]